MDSTSLGDGARFQTFNQLQARLDSLLIGPRDRGRVALIVRRGEGGRRETLDRVVVTPEGGIPGDSWGRQSTRALDGQITVMEREVAELIANGQPLTLFGDNLFLELDLSAGNVPPGSRLRVGGAILQVTPKPHYGCRKFRGRFGDAALRFVANPDTRHRNLRGIYLHVIEEGSIGCGDAVDVLSRPRDVQSQA